jgi:uncharacterized protein (TIGR01777 family)
MRVFVTGGTGLVGGRLVTRLLERGDQVALLTRRPEAAQQKWGERCTIVAGDPTQAGAWMDAVKECDAVVHLAGESVFGQRWNEAIKQALVNSRVQGTSNVVAALARQPQSADGRPKVLVSASAIGYYGPHGDEELSEEAAAGADFLAHVCVDWEKTAHTAEAHGIRVAILRIGIVLDREGGALQKMLPPFKMFVGGPVGTGRQYMSWIHIDDLVGLILFALDHREAQGVYNATAPQPVTNKEFSTVLGHVLHRPSFMAAPKFALKLMLGEAAEIVTEGQRVLPRHALAQGYGFRFPQVNEALQDLLGKK